MNILKNLCFNVIILYTISYILKRKINIKYIILGSVIGAYRIFFPIIFDILMLLVVFKNKITVLYYIIICILLKNTNILLSPIVLYIYIMTYKQKQYYKTTIVLENQKITLKGFMDTGNKLIYFNKPVILINKKHIKNIKKYFYIPYTTIDNQSILKAIKPKYIIINNRKIYNVIIGLIEVDVDLILNPKIMEE